MSKITRYIPEIMKENDTMDSIYSTQKTEVERLDECINTIFNNNFTTTSDLQGVKNYETILEIKSDSSLDLETRKQNIIDELTYRPPFTRQRLQFILEKVFGEGNYIFQIKPNDFEVIVEIETTNSSYYITYSKKIRNIIPANMFLVLSLPYTYIYLKKMYTYSKMEAEFNYEELSKYSKEEMINEIY